MKIGSFLPLQSNPGKQPGQTFSLPNPDSSSKPSSEKPSSEKSSAPALVQAIDSAEALSEYLASAEKSAPVEKVSGAEAELFNLDREFPRSTRDALAAYSETEAYQTFSQGELVGVDLYI